MIDVALIPLLIASALGFVIGAKYILASAFMPYQAAVAGRDWAQLDAGLQVVLLGMLKIVGAGFATLGLTLVWLSVAIYDGVRWAPWAILTISTVSLAPTLYVSVMLRSFQPQAKTPIAPTLAAIGLIVAGVGLSVIALR